MSKILHFCITVHRPISMHHLHTAPKHTRRRRRRRRRRGRRAEKLAPLKNKAGEAVKSTNLFPGLLFALEVRFGAIRLLAASVVVRAVQAGRLVDLVVLQTLQRDHLLDLEHPLLFGAQLLVAQLGLGLDVQVLPLWYREHLWLVDLFDWRGKGVREEVSLFGTFNCSNTLPGK